MKTFVSKITLIGCIFLFISTGVAAQGSVPIHDCRKIASYQNGEYVFKIDTNEIIRAFEAEFTDTTRIRRVYIGIQECDLFIYGIGSRRGNSRVINVALSKVNDDLYIFPQAKTQSCSGVCCSECWLKLAGGCECFTECPRENEQPGYCNHSISSAIAGVGIGLLLR